MFIERTQKDDDATNEFYGDLAGIDTGPDSLVRQEDKEAADLNWLLSRHGMEVPMRHTLFQEAEIDYDLDLQEAHNNVQAAVMAYNRLDPELKTKYKNWQSLMYAVFTGELKTLKLTPPRTTETPNEPPNPNP